MRTLVLAWLFLAGLAASALAQEIPAPRGYVTDETRMMTPEDRIGLEERLAAFQAKSGVEIAIVLVSTLHDLPVEAYLARLWAAWRVGRSGAGVVLLVAPGQGQARMEFDANLRGRITDADCDDIIRSQMVPEFTQGRVSAGVVRGADELMRRIEEGAARYAKAHPPRLPSEEEDDSLGSILCVGLVLIGIVVLFLGSRRRGRGAQGGR